MIVSRLFWWLSTVAVGVGVSASAGFSLGAMSCADVCVATSRWKSSVGSEVMESASSSSALSPASLFAEESWGGIVETFCSSFSFSVRKFALVVWAKSWRALVRLASIGLTRYSLAP